MTIFSTFDNHVQWSLEKNATIWQHSESSEFIPLSSARKIFVLRSSSVVGRLRDFSATAAAERVSVETPTKIHSVTNDLRQIFTSAGTGKTSLSYFLELGIFLCLWLIVSNSISVLSLHRSTNWCVIWFENVGWQSGKHEFCLEKLSFFSFLDIPIWSSVRAALSAIRSFYFQLLTSLLVVVEACVCKTFNSPSLNLLPHPWCLNWLMA